MKLLVEDNHVDESAVKQPPNLMGAVRTIIIADFVMSLDNSIAIAAAAKGNMYLVVFGLALSVPIIIAGSALILRLMTRFPMIIAAGGALLGWLAGDMIATDPLLAEELVDTYWPRASAGGGTRCRACCCNRNDPETAQQSIGPVEAHRIINQQRMLQGGGRRDLRD